MYITISGILIQVIPIHDPLAELFICILGLICVSFSIVLFKEKK
jgi:hypothetical protein